MMLLIEIVHVVVVNTVEDVPLHKVSLFAYELRSLKIESMYAVIGLPLSVEGAAQVKTTLVPD
jgi:hypothetical protein